MRTALLALAISIAACDSSPPCEVGARRCRGSTVDVCLPEGWVIEQRCTAPAGYVAYCSPEMPPVWAECVYVRDGV